MAPKASYAPVLSGVKFSTFAVIQPHLAFVPEMRFFSNAHHHPLRDFRYFLIPSDHNKTQNWDAKPKGLNSSV